MSELLYAIALTKLRGLSLANAKKLYEQVGSAKKIFDNADSLPDLLSDANAALLADVFADSATAIETAKREIDFMQQKRMRGITMSDPDYPVRLHCCPDAPVVLYQCGECNLNRKRVINIVGTRKCTEYGREMVNSFVRELKRACPDVLIVSGLAYGIDICAHRAALANGMDTIGVLAHGLDNIYPPLHRPVAVEMVGSGGGLLTEYTTHTIPEKGNFVRRNRIVAGMTDACIVAESASKGGSLITANLSFDYSRDVFVFPGRVGDESSAGCNALIKQNKAALIENAKDFIDAMGWETAPSSQSQQIEMFPILSPAEQKVMDTLSKVDEKHINKIAEDTQIDFSTIAGVLFELEMKGLVRPLGGGVYRRGVS